MNLEKKVQESQTSGVFVDSNVNLTISSVVLVGIIAWYTLPLSSQKQLEQAQATVEKYDLNGDNALNLQELKEAIRNQFGNEAGTRAIEIMDRHDQNYDKTLNAEEFSGCIKI